MLTLQEIHLVQNSLFCIEIHLVVIHVVIIRIQGLQSEAFRCFTNPSEKMTDWLLDESSEQSNWC